MSDSAWFQQMYEGRSRTAQLQTSYLMKERRFVEDFARDNLSGPCLEIGCGAGLFADLVPGFVGLEYEPTALRAEGFEGYRRLCADACRLPFPDAAFDCVLSFNTLEHVREIDVALAEIDRVTKPGGYLILKPAWQCTRHTTELIPVLPYAELGLRQKVVKALLPVLRSRPYKLSTRLPPRVWRRLRARPKNPLRWRRLIPYHGPMWTADADATTDIDCHEAILFFETRGYDCLSHRTLPRKFLAGHDIVVLRKSCDPAAS